MKINKYSIILLFVLMCGCTTTTIVQPPLSPPSNLVYQKNKIDAQIGTALPNVSCTMNGTGTFSISPALPAGLMIDTNNGNIYGTPTIISLPFKLYTVTARNTAGSTSVVIVLYVRDTKPTIVWLGDAGTVGFNSGVGIELTIFQGANQLPLPISISVTTTDTTPGGPIIYAITPQYPQPFYQSYGVTFTGNFQPIPGTWQFKCSAIIDGNYYESINTVAIKQQAY